MRTRHLKALVSLASQSGRPLFTVPTGSMTPTLRAGDLVAVERCAANGLCRGDIVVFERAGALWAHRLLGRGPGGRLYVKGDAALGADDPVREDEVLGRASYAVRGGRRINLSGTWARAKGLLVGAAYPVARAPLAGARALGRKIVGSRGAVRVAIGGARLEIIAMGPDLRGLVYEVAGANQTRRRGADLRVVLRRADRLPEAVSPGGARRDGGALLVWGPDFRARIDPARGLCEAGLSNNAGAEAVSCVIRNAATECASRAGRAVLHASCALRGGMAYVFAGASGTGKTTCAGLLPESDKVLDDLVFVGLARGRAAVFASPDFGREGGGLAGGPVPVGGVLVLAAAEEDDRPACERLTGAAAAAALCALPGPAADSGGAVSALGAAAELASRVDVVRLRFGLTGGELDAVVSGLAAELDLSGTRG